MDYTYKETEPYEKGFASYYLKAVVPVLEEARQKQVEAVTQLRLRWAIVGGLIAVAGLAWLFGIIDGGTFAGIPLEWKGIAAFALLAAATWFLKAPREKHRTETKRLIVPRILKFFGPYYYGAKGGIDRDVLRLPLFPEWSQAEQEDSISGKHRGQRFEFAEVK